MHCTCKGTFPRSCMLQQKTIKLLTLLDTGVSLSVREKHRLKLLPEELTDSSCIEAEDTLLESCCFTIGPDSRLEMPEGS